MRHIVPISGKDSLATAIWLRAKYPQIEFEYIHNNTYVDPPEIKGWLSRVEAFLGAEIHHIGANLTDIIYDQKVLPSRNMRYCTRLAKIQPMEQYLNQGDEVKLYLGLRADEGERIGYQSGSTHITPVYPLRDDGLSLAHVYKIVDQYNLMPPSFFWRSLFHAVMREMGKDANLIRNFTRPEFYALFAWRSRPNCFYCYFQRLYEWVGLYEHHPRLFYEAIQIENDNGASGYTFRKDYPLTRFLDPMEQKRIKERRVKDLVKVIYARSQRSLFDDTPYDELAVTSCGLFCGK